MNEHIRQILARRAALKGELRLAVQSQARKTFFQIKGRRFEVESSVKAAHCTLKQNFFHWLVTNRPQNLITGPIIYSMVPPMLFFDACVSFFQWACFPVYGIARVRLADYGVFDRHPLQYLKWIEKFHCTCCEYGNGLMGCVRELLARTEEYFCPIKHAHKVPGSHARYNRFLDYGDAERYEARLQDVRIGLGKAK